MSTVCLLCCNLSRLEINSDVRYTYALQSLSHALILAPQNPYHFLQFAETAYLASDIPLSLKTYLQVVDMTDDDDEDVPPSDSIPTSITLRAWFGVKLVRPFLYRVYNQLRTDRF